MNVLKMRWDQVRINEFALEGQQKSVNGWWNDNWQKKLKFSDTNHIHHNLTTSVSNTPSFHLATLRDDRKHHVRRFQRRHIITGVTFKNSMNVTRSSRSLLTKLETEFRDLKFWWRNRDHRIWPDIVPYTWVVCRISTQIKKCKNCAFQFLRCVHFVSSCYQLWWKTIVTVKVTKSKKCFKMYCSAFFS